MADKVRILRVLEYEGDREVVEKTLAKGGVPANGVHTAQNITIRSALLGLWPQGLVDNPMCVPGICDQVTEQFRPLVEELVNLCYGDYIDSRRRGWSGWKSIEKNGADNVIYRMALALDELERQEAADKRRKSDLTPPQGEC